MIGARGKSADRVRARGGAGFPNRNAKYHSRRDLKYLTHLYRRIVDENRTNLRFSVPTKTRRRDR